MSSTQEGANVASRGLPVWMAAGSWRKPGVKELFLDAARFVVSRPATFALPAVVTCIVSGVGGVGLALAGRNFYPSAPLAATVSAGASSAFLIALLLTPYVGSSAMSAALSLWGGARVHFERIRWYRLLGTTLYLAIPVTLLTKLFPPGMVAIPFYIWWAFAPYVVLLEGDGGRTALRRSRMLSVGEFSATALPVALSLAVFYAGLIAASRLVPQHPAGFLPSDSGGYQRTLAEGEKYDPTTRILTHPDGKASTVPADATYDAETRTLHVAPPPEVAVTVALTWVGVPWLLAMLLEPIRWTVLAWVYLNLRIRREGLTPAEAFDELRRDT
ncbi:hypothetical protein FJZ36_06825 [Candidatus Poribacteria bacterium]|nr:hypothetical protein [Candidatus Poribacteria bacterium]